MTRLPHRGRSPRKEGHAMYLSWFTGPGSMTSCLQDLMSEFLNGCQIALQSHAACSCLLGISFFTIATGELGLYGICLNLAFTVPISNMRSNMTSGCCLDDLPFSCSLCIASLSFAWCCCWIGIKLAVPLCPKVGPHVTDLLNIA